MTPREKFVRLIRNDILRLDLPSSISASTASSIIVEDCGLIGHRKKSIC